MQTNDITVEVLRDVIERACETWPASKGRIERGGFLALMGAVERIDSSSWRVASQSEPGVSYRVEDVPATCECPDVSRAPAGICKHQWAVSLLEIARQRQQRVDRRRAREAQQERAQERASASRVALAVAGAARGGWRP